MSLLEGYTSFYKFNDRGDKLENLEQLYSELLQDYTKPTGDYKQKLDILLEKLPSMLLDFKKYFIIYSKSPENTEYQSYFQNIQKNLTQLKSEMFTLLNDVQTNTTEINQKMIQMDVLIRKERKRNKELKRKLGIIDTKSNTTSQLITNYTEMYDTDYMRNWSVFLSILAIWFITRQVYK